MDHDQVDFDLAHSPAIWLLNSENRALVLSFLYQYFKQEQRITIPLGELTVKLDRYLDSLRERYPERYTRSAQAYLKTWSDDEHQILRIYPQGPDSEDVVQLTTDAERAINWVEGLSQRVFIGTESRFLQIFGLLEEIVARSTEDVDTRIAQLRNEQDTLQQEIDQILATGETNPLTPTQIRERFIQANAVARQLISDFTSVEQNFRTLVRSVREAQLQPDARKGQVIASVLDADARLKESDEGGVSMHFGSFSCRQPNKTSCVCFSTLLIAY